MKYWSLILLFVSLILCSFGGAEDDDNEDDYHRDAKFNFASHAAGAVVLDKSPESAKGFSNLLVDDKDKYGISPCNEKKWVVIGLSEDIMITSVVIANYERYSSMLKDFQLFASISYPTTEWIDLGTYTAEPKLGEQHFNISSSSSAHTRYLKIKFKTHYDNDALCTLSQVKVHGVTVIASFKQEVEWSDTERLNMLQQLSHEIQEEEAAKELVNQTDDVLIPTAEAVSVEAVPILEEMSIVQETSHEPTQQGVPSTEVVDETVPAITAAAEPEDAAVESSTLVEGVSTDNLTDTSNTTVQSAGSHGLELVTGFIQSLMNLATPPTAEKMEDSVRAENETETALEFVGNNSSESDASTDSVIQPVESVELAEATVVPRAAADRDVPLEVEETMKSTTTIDVVPDEVEESQVSLGHAESTIDDSKTVEASTVGLELEDSVISAVELQSSLPEDLLEQNASSTTSEVMVASSVAVVESPSVVEEPVVGSAADVPDSETVPEVAVNATIDTTLVTVDDTDPAGTLDAEESSSEDDLVVSETAASTKPASVPTADPAVESADITTTKNISNSTTVATVSVTMSGGALPLLNCYDTLKLVDFQAKMIAKLKNSNSSMFEVDSAMPKTDSSNSNFFRILMQRIKSLEINNAIMDMYIIQLTECYRTVTKDIMSSKILLDNMSDAKAHMAIVERLQETALFRQNSSQELVTTRHALMMQRRSRINRGEELLGEEYFTLLGILGLWLSCLLGAADTSFVAEITEVYVDENRVALIVGAFLLSFGSVAVSIGVCCWFYFALKNSNKSQWSTKKR